MRRGRREWQQSYNSSTRTTNSSINIARIEKLIKRGRGKRREREKERERQSEREKVSDAATAAATATATTKNNNPKTVASTSHELRETD